MTEDTPLAAEISRIRDFLGCPTPQAWLDHASNDIPLLLLDHAHCEKKAAATALSLIQRYPQHLDLLNRMSRLAREELRHFEQVLSLLNKRGIAYENISAARYASGLHQHVRNTEPNRLVDTLIIGAIIEARSCERFASLIPVLESELGQFYQRLLKSEARHFQDYLDLAEQIIDKQALPTRIAFFISIEQELIENSDQQFRFHSGIPLDNSRESNT